MKTSLTAALAAGAIAAALGGAARAQPPGPQSQAPQSQAPQTPTTRILAIGAIVPGGDLQQARAILPAEVRATAQLYLDGKIDQWFSLEDRNGVAFILNLTDVKAAQEMLEALPLGKAHLMTFELIPIGPLNPLRQLLGPAPAGK